MKPAVKKERIGPTVTVAVVQAASVAFDTKKTLAKALDLTQDAARLGAKLVLFPEAFISGYPRGLDFGAAVGWRTDAGREDFKRYFESAVAVPGPIVDALSKAARANSVYLVIGVIERERGTLYCCVLFFAPDGTFLGKHRKVMPTASERLIWGYGDGSTLPVFDTPLGKLGAVICWENYMPLLRTFMYSQGIEIYCAPTADHRPVWSATMQHIATEGRCFVSPFGEFLAGPNFEEETILVAELDRGLLPKAKFDFDVVGHYSRPDIFSLTVDDRVKPPVATLSSKAKPSKAE